MNKVAASVTLHSSKTASRSFATTLLRLLLLSTTSINVATTLAFSLHPTNVSRAKKSNTMKSRGPSTTLADASTTTTTTTATTSRWLSSSHFVEREAEDDTASFSSSSAASPRVARRGDVVSVDLNLRPSFGLGVEPLFDRSGVVSFVLGAGNYVPGLHDLIEGLAYHDEERTSDRARVEGARVDAGWGAPDPDLVIEVPTSRLPPSVLDGLEVGTRLRLGDGRSCVATDVGDDVVVLDANHELAGSYYECDLELLRVEKAPAAFASGTSITANDDDDDGPSRYRVATFALGCFWSAELAFMRVPGVVGTRVGYTQGHVPRPTYEEVCSETTGHTESVMLVYDPNLVSFKKLLKIALERLGDDVYRSDRVGNDEGSQYRSGVYHHDDRQRFEAEDALRRLGDGVETEVLPAREFYNAEDYHQQYLLKGGQSAKKNAKEYIRCYG